MTSNCMMQGTGQLSRTGLLCACYHPDMSIHSAQRRAHAFRPVIRRLAGAVLALSATLAILPITGAKEPSSVSAAATRQAFPQPDLTPFAQAIADGDVPRIRQLAPSVDLQARGDQQVTLLEWAIWNQQPAALQVLLELGADPAQIGMDNETVAHMAAAVDDPQYLSILLAHQAPVDIPATDTRRTPLFKAAQSHRHAQLDLLIQAGADIGHVDATGNSVLHTAGSNADTVLRLLEAGVDARLTNAQGVTFQRYFFMTPARILNADGQRGRQEVIAWLNNHGITVEQR